MFHTIVRKESAWIGWFQPNAMMKLVTVEIFVAIGNSRDMKMHVFIHIQLVERVGGYVQVSLLKETSSSCNT